jgi:DNA mismatch repair protein MutH
VSEQTINWGGAPTPCVKILEPAPSGALRDADAGTILEFASGIQGHRPCEYGLASRMRTAGKGNYGCLIEHVFGLNCDNRPEPDFRSAAIELKSTKLELLGSQWKVGERTSLHMIDFEAVAREVWPTATVRAKLSRLLFCFYRWLPEVEPVVWPVDRVLLWEPDELQWRYLREDWELIQSRCAKGEAHLLSESDTRVLGAATKAATGIVRRKQAAGGPPARPRVFALKQPFVRAIYDVAIGRPKLESLSKVLGLTTLRRFEDALLTKLRAYGGRTVRSLADETSMAPSSAKHYSSLVVQKVVKKLLGLKDPSAQIREFAEFGIEMHVVPMRRNGRPKEALSFPAFRYVSLLNEAWDTSDLKVRLNRLMFIPIWEPYPGALVNEWTLGRAFFWSPDHETEQLIRREWEMFRREIREGRANDLTPASRTQAIHVRPHARDSQDVDLAPVIGPVVKKSFWLNQDFVAAIVRRYSSVSKT